MTGRRSHGRLSALNGVVHQGKLVAWAVARPARPRDRRLALLFYSRSRQDSLKARTALLRKLKVTFRRFRSQPIGRVVSLINPILRGWVHYFAVGHSSRCFSFVKDWVDKKVRRHLMRARHRRGFGWKQWSRQWLHTELGLFNNYRVRRVSPVPTAWPTR